MLTLGNKHMLFCYIHHYRVLLQQQCVVAVRMMRQAL